MGDMEFVQLVREVLYEMRPMYDREGYDKIYPKLKKIQNYIYNNPNNIYVKDFITEFTNRYKSLFYNQELINAFNIPDYLYYYKQFQIYRNLPYTSHPLYAAYLPETLIVPSNLYRDEYPAFTYILKYYLKEDLNEHLQAILNFVEKNDVIMHGGKDKYYDLENEKSFYHMAKVNANFKEFNDYVVVQESTDLYILRNDFMNKRVGNIGELYSYESIQNQPFKCLVSRDIGNGFGYDIYFLDSNSIENLVEVKTTLNQSEDDYFSLSENEYKVMRSCINNPKSRYIIYRVILDSHLNPRIIPLTMEDNITFVDGTGKMQYKLYPTTDRNKYFKKYNSKTKILINS